MAKTAVLAVKIISDTTGARKGLDETGGLVGKLGGIGTAAVAGLTAAAVAVGAIAVTGIQAAGDLEQSIGAIDTVFKGGAGQMHAWADDAAVAVGLTKNEFNTLGTLIGTQLKNGGTAMDELGPKTNELIGLGADLASMFGGTTADAVGALSSALKGERDPIERYGVSLTQASIDAKAAEMGFVKVGGALSAEANQAATLALIMQQTADAHGNFAAEAGTMQGQQARLTATLENTRATIGMALLPVVNQLLGLFSTHLLPVIVQLADAFSAWMAGQDVEGTLTAIMAAVMPLVTGIQSLGLQLRPLIPIVARLVTEGIMPLAATIATALGPVISTLATTIIPPLVAAIAAIMPKVIEVMGVLGELVTVVAGVLGPAITALSPVVETVFSAVSNIISAALDTVSAIIRTATSAIQGDWAGAWDGVKDIVRGAWDTIKALIGGALDVVQSLLSNAASGLRNAGWDMMAGLVDGINNAISWVRDAAANAARAALNAAKRVLGIASPSRVMRIQVGQQTGRGLVLGLRDMRSAVEAEGRKLADAAVFTPSPAQLSPPTARRLGGYTAHPAAEGMTVTININGGLIDRATVEQLRRMLADLDRRRGIVPSNAGGGR